MQSEATRLLFDACTAGDLAAVQTLLDDDHVDVNAFTVLGDTPLQIAVMAKQLPIVQALLKHPHLDLFRKSERTNRAALDIARSELESDNADDVRTRELVTMLLDAACVYAAWVDQRVDGTLRNKWLKRFCRIFRNADPTQIEIALYQRDEPRFLLSPCAKLTMTTSMFNIDATPKVSRHEFRVTLGSRNRFTRPEKGATPTSIQFGVDRREDLAIWQSVLGGLRVSGAFESTARTRDAAVPSAPSMGEDEPQDNVQPYMPVLVPPTSLAQEQKDLAEAMRLSLQDVPMAARSPRSPVNEDEEDCCVVCMNGPKNAVCVPCGHNVMCLACGGQVLQSSQLCPVCRQHVHSIMKIFRV